MSLKSSVTKSSDTETSSDKTNSKKGDGYYSEPESESESESELTISCDYEEILENNENIFEVDENYDNDSILKGDNRISLNRMTRYEKVRIIGERTKQLTLGAKCFIKNKEDFDYEFLATEELKLKLVPFKIIRKLPNNIKEEWSIDELQLDHLFD
tara:strand:- start:7197 stop:7664 length:468 start_codon:yes stop_codon:yes gene_type:complete